MASDDLSWHDTASGRRFDDERGPDGRTWLIEIRPGEAVVVDGVLCLRIPRLDVAEINAEWLRQQKIDELQDMHWWQVLGVRAPDEV
jgi:hypothetical protein